MSIKKSTSLPYRKSVGILIVNSVGAIWVGLRLNNADSNNELKWQLPQGGLNKGEKPLLAAYRELYEETSIKEVELICENPQWVSYDFPVELKTKPFSGKYRGQIQKWYLFKYKGDDRAINIRLDSDKDYKPEFAKWMWSDFDFLLANTVEFKRPVYEAIHKCFSSKLSEIRNTFKV